MMAPSMRLIGVCALTLVPTAVLAAMLPHLAGWAMVVPALVALTAIVDGVLGTRRLQKLDAEAPGEWRMTQGQPAALPLRIRNESGEAMRAQIAPVVPSGVEAVETVSDVVAPQGESQFLWECTADTRGDHVLTTINLQVLSACGLWHVRRRRSGVCTLRVFPDLRDRATAALLQRSRRPGVVAQRQLGKGREFDRLRQYMPGDSYEDVYWKGTARRATPVVRLHRVEHAQQVYVVIDCSRLSARPGVLDGYVGAALHLMLTAERYGDLFGLATFSDRVHTSLQARNGSKHYSLCRDAIYNLTTQRVHPDFGEVFSTLQARIARRSLLVFLTSLDDALLAEQFEQEVVVIARRHLVAVHSMRLPTCRPVFGPDPPNDLDGAYAGLAGQLEWNRMERMKRSLSLRGVRLSLLDPERAKVQIASAYLAIKQRQLL